MLIDDIKNEILINELQLGEKLNHCVHHKERSQFSLLLAMLTDDVEAHSQFFLPKTEQAPHQSNENQLRKKFNLPDKQAFAIEDLSQVNAFNQAKLIKDNRLTELYLINALKPNPLAFRDNKQFIEKDIMENTSLYCQKKHESENCGKSYAQSRLNFKGDEWLNTVNDSINMAI